MEDVILTVCRAVAAVVVLLTVYSMWTSLLTLALTVLGVVMTLRHMEQTLETFLPGEGKVVFITGCDTGIGHQAALSASQRGMTVVAGVFNEHSPGAERLRKVKRVHVVEVDVTRDVTIQAALRQVTELCEDKGLWGVVNVAGMNRQAPVELTSMATFQHVSDVMLFGTIRVTKALLPWIRRAKGRVVTISSDRGLLSPATSGAYCIAKHGIETISDVLSAELAPFGVSVSIMQVGHFGGATAIINPQAVDAMRTSMESDLNQCSEEVQLAYGGQAAVDRLLSEVESSRHTSCPDIKPVVRAIIRALLSTRPPARCPVHGQLAVMDWGIVLGQWKPLIPDSLLPWVQSILFR